MANEKKRILVVDDEEDTRIYFRNLLEDNGFEAEEAVDGTDGMMKIKEFKPNLVTLDMSMPEKSGVKLYRDLRESAEFAKLPVIIVTGISDTFKDFISSRKQVPPPEGYISKPIDPEQFIQMVSKLV